jgi:hypothetical protein
VLYFFQLITTGRKDIAVQAIFAVRRRTAKTLEAHGKEDRTAKTERRTAKNMRTAKLLHAARQRNAARQSSYTPHGKAPLPHGKGLRTAKNADKALSAP